MSELKCKETKDGVLTRSLIIILILKKNVTGKKENVFIRRLTWNVC